MKLLITCEHAANAIPHQYIYLFKEQKDVLSTHEGYDPGAYDLYKYLEPLSNASYAQDIGRLLIETNRSLHHPKLFSRFSKVLEHSKKSEIIAETIKSHCSKLILKRLDESANSYEILFLATLLIQNLPLIIL